MRKTLIILALGLASLPWEYVAAQEETIGIPNVVLNGRMRGDYFFNQTVPNGQLNAIRATAATQSLLRFHPVGQNTTVAQFFVNNNAGEIILQNNPSGTPENNVILRGNGVSFFNGGNVGIGIAGPTAPLHVNGTTKTSVLEITGGSDLSEQFTVTSNAEPGTVLCIDVDNPGALVGSTKAYDRTVAGVVSGAGGLNVGMLMGQEGSVAHGAHPVALTGRVYVKATNAGGVIVPGDLLTTSDVAGHAMKVTDYSQAHGAVIGKALTALDAETGLVLVLVSLQ